MFAYLKGKIIEKNFQNNSFVLEVNNIGYLLESSSRNLSKLNQGTDYRIDVLAINNEEGTKLFAFLSKTEKELFQMLIKISGIGPKSAIHILDCFEVDQFISAVIRGDSKLIEQAHGIGNKTAQRIILELKNKFKNISQIENTNQTTYKVQNDITMILNNLGLSYLEIDKKLIEAKNKNIPDDAEMLIRYCLQN